jgi:hypothetical protein
LSSSQRTQWPPRRQEAHERGLEVALLGPDLGLQRRGRALEEQLAVGEHEHPVGVALGLPHVVGGEDDGGPASARERRDELPELRALARVQRGARLVEQQHGRVGEQPDRDVHPLLVAARELAELVARRARPAP